MTRFSTESTTMSDVLDGQHVAGLPRVHGFTLPAGRIKCAPEDFVVEEIPYIEPEGDGEHLWLWIRKRGINTAWLASRLAEVAGVDESTVGYAGLKDRNAVTTQWFSLPCAADASISFDAIENDDVTILRQARHDQKLRRGALTGNRFEIVIRDCHISQSSDGFQFMVERIASIGVPNYFMGQRFGHDEDNLKNAVQMFSGALRPTRHKRGLYLSAARAMLFNRVLAARVERDNWNRVIDGDWLNMAGTTAGFWAIKAGDDLQRRLDAFEVHVTGPMWGKNCEFTRKQAQALEAEILSSFTDWTEALEKGGLRCDRRALRVKPQGMSVEKLDSGVFRLEFALPAGAYATAVLRELVVFD